jgi:hypothetical protein
VKLSLARVLSLAASPRDYKLHLACWNGYDQPLDVYLRSRDEWDGWNSYRGTRDDFSRRYIVSFMEFYHERDSWLYGGTYEVLERGGERYRIQLLPEGRELIGRLKIGLKRPGRAKAFRLENCLEQIEIAEILREPYSGRAFPGYEQINHTFAELEPIFRRGRPDWKAPLESVKGVYLITDASNGKRYVGAAYGLTGVWSRWSCYIGTGHGWNDELTSLIDAKGIEHARQHFRFVLLDYRPMKSDDQTIIDRETFWKQALMSRLPWGYNAN